MQKDFDRWNEKKKYLDTTTNTLFFKTGEIWWVHFGLNIGFEMNGKGSEFMRPVLIIKKYNQYSFLAIPLSTSIKTNKYRIHIGEIDGKQATANLSQIKNIDSKRLINKVGYIDQILLKAVKEKTSQINFS